MYIWYTAYVIQCLLLLRVLYVLLINSEQACSKLVAVMRRQSCFYWFIDKCYVQQSKDDNTRNNNKKPSTKIKENIQSY